MSHTFASGAYHPARFARYQNSLRSCPAAPYIDKRSGGVADHPRSNSVDHDVIVQWSSADGTAVAGSDYEAASGTLTISAGASSGTIVVRAIGDNDAEPDKTFVVNLDSVNGATVLDGQGEGNILDDDSGGGGGNGGGKGGGKPNRSVDEALLVVDELWYFESVNGHDHEDHADVLAAPAVLPVFNQALQQDEQEDDFADVLAPTEVIDSVIKSGEFSGASDAARYVSGEIDPETQSESEHAEDEASESSINDSEIKQVLTSS